MSVSKFNNSNGNQESCSNTKSRSMFIKIILQRTLSPSLFFLFLSHSDQVVFKIAPISISNIFIINLQDSIVL